MAVLPIRFYGDPVLRKKARELTREELTAEFHSFVQDMGETMYENSGIGLAANQVGDLRRVFTMDIAQVVGERRGGRRKKNPELRELLVFINPEVLDSSVEDEKYTEGCLSIPALEQDVYRPIRILVRYRTPEWELREEWIDGLKARVFQHELDHLDGRLFIDLIPDSAREKMAGALNRIKKMTEEERATMAQNPTA